MGSLHAHAVTKAIQRANKLDVASEVRWARAIGLKKVCSLMRSKREPHYPRTCEQGSAEAMAVLHVMLSTLKRRHPTAQTRVSLCATCTGPCGTTDVADAGGATSLQDRPTSYKQGYQDLGGRYPYLPVKSGGRILRVSDLHAW